MKAVFHAPIRLSTVKTFFKALTEITIFSVTALDKEPIYFWSENPTYHLNK